MARQKEQKKAISICDVNVDNIVISNLIETKNDSKSLIGYLDEVLTLFRMGGGQKALPPPPPPPTAFPL